MHKTNKIKNFCRILPYKKPFKRCLYKTTIISVRNNFKKIGNLLLGFVFLLVNYIQNRTCLFGWGDIYNGENE